jgi:hypothetical protein
VGATATGGAETGLVDGAVLLDVVVVVGEGVAEAAGPDVGVGGSAANTTAGSIKNGTTTIPRKRRFSSFI